MLGIQKGVGTSMIMPIAIKAATVAIRTIAAVITIHLSFIFCHLPSKSDRAPIGPITPLYHRLLFLSIQSIMRGMISVDANTNTKEVLSDLNMTAAEVDTKLEEGWDSIRAEHYYSLEKAMKMVKEETAVSV